VLITIEIALPVGCYTCLLRPRRWTPASLFARWPMPTD